MDKYEFKLRSEEIDRLMEQQMYTDAVRLADTIDWKRVKSATTLAKIADLYRLNKRFEECRDILEMAYDRNPGNRTVVYALCEISLQFGDIVEAIEYFKEYAKLAPKDTGVYVLRYRIYEAQNVGFEEKIELLEELKKTDRIEEWEYELAYLYHRAGFATKCVEECDEIILWFGEGPYVIKAMELKMLHEPLTPSQQERYDRRNEEKFQVAAQAARERNTGEMDLDDDFRVKTIDMSKFNTMNLQAELAENLKEYINDEPTPLYTGGTNREDQLVYHNTIPADAQEVFFADQTSDIRYQVPTAVNAVEETPEMGAFKESFAQEYVGTQPPRSMGQLTEEPYDEGTRELPVSEVSTDTARVMKRDVQEIRFEEEISSEADFMVSDTRKIGPVNTEMVTFEQFLAQESDGQISLATEPEGKAVEKQITGQLNIQDILSDWEKMKKEREQKMQADVRQKVLEQTGQIFSQFAVSSKTGILASLDDPSLLDNYGEEASSTVMKGLENHANQVIMPKSEEAENEFSSFSELPIVEQLTPELIESAVAESAEATVIETEEEEDVEGRETIVNQFTGHIKVEDEFEASMGQMSDEETELFLAQMSADYKTSMEDAEAEVDAEEVMQDAEYVADETELEVQEESEGMTEDEIQESEEASEEIEGYEEMELSEEKEIAETENSAEESYPFAESGEGNFYASVTEAIPGSIWKEVDGYTEAETVAEEETSEEEVSEEDSMQDQDDVASVEEQEMAETKDLTKEEKELFQSFLYSKKMKKQILDTLDRITLAAYAGNVVITADAQENALQLAKLIVTYVRRCDDNFSGNVAKIDAEKLNTKDISKICGKLVNGALLVEGAGKINSKTMRSLLQELNQETSGIIVILMDKKRAMDTLMSRGAVIEEFFNARVDILSMNVDMLVNYGIKYVKEKGFTIDEMGRLALYKCISEMQAGNHTVTISEVKEIMEDAMYSANRGGLSKMASAIMGKRKDENGLIILKEKDFD